MEMRSGVVMMILTCFLTALDAVTHGVYTRKQNTGVMGLGLGVLGALMLFVCDTIRYLSFISGVWLGHLLGALWGIGYGASKAWSLGLGLVGSRNNHDSWMVCGVVLFLYCKDYFCIFACVGIHCLLLFYLQIRREKVYYLPS